MLRLGYRRLLCLQLASHTYFSNDFISTTISNTICRIWIYIMKEKVNWTLILEHMKYITAECFKVLNREDKLTELPFFWLCDYLNRDRL